MFWAIFVIFAHSLGVLTAVRAIMDTRTAQGAIAWAIILVVFPYLSVPAYWIFGRTKFHGYISKRRDELLKTDQVAQQLHAEIIARALLAEPGREHGRLIEHLAKLPFTTGNDLELLVDGAATFRSIFEGIATAQSYLLVEFYILRDDELGRKLQQALIAKARSGVRVRVIFDEVGSKHLSKTYQDELREGGVEIHPFNTRHGPSNRWQVNFRNHRKIVVVDGVSAWVGGLNVGDEYVGLGQKLHPWRDTHVKVTGPAALGAQFAFYEDWHWATQEFLDLRWDAEPAQSGARRTVLALPSAPSDPLETCTLFFLHVVNRAEHRLWIATPYFIPDEQFISALQLAALRGVDVRLLIPGLSDGPLVGLSNWCCTASLMDVGIKVYRYPGFTHQKVVLVDSDYATVGTANFDNRSFRLNFEITVAVADADFATQVARMLENDFARSHQVTEQEIAGRGFWFRFGARAARLLSPVQ